MSGRWAWESESSYHKRLQEEQTQHAKEMAREAKRQTELLREQQNSNYEPPRQQSRSNSNTGPSLIGRFLYFIFVDVNKITYSFVNYQSRGSHLKTLALLIVPLVVPFILFTFLASGYYHEDTKAVVIAPLIIAITYQQWLVFRYVKWLIKRSFKTWLAFTLFPFFWTFAFPMSISAIIAFTEWLSTK